MFVAWLSFMEAIFLTKKGFFFVGRTLLQILVIKILDRMYWPGSGSGIEPMRNQNTANEACIEYDNFTAVLGIRDILVRIWIPGSSD